MEENMLSFGIAFRDSKGNEYYATVYKSKNPTTLYAIHFFDQVTKDEYDVLIVGVVSGKLVTIEYPKTLIPDIGEQVSEEIEKHLTEIGEPVD